MTNPPARPGYTLEHITAARDSQSVENWRVTDPADNRIATCYDESNGRAVVAALNGATVALDPSAVSVIREQADNVKAVASYPSTSSSTGATLVAAAALIKAACDGLERAGRQLAPAIDTRREHSLEADPYRFNGVQFADVFDFEALRNEDRSRLIVRQRILDDVEGTHRMLDDLDVPGGTLSARLGIALVRASAAASAGASSALPSVEQRTRDGWLSLYGAPGTRGARPIGRGGDPVPDGVRIPEAHRIIAQLEDMPGEDVFRIFTRLKLVPADRDVVQSWNFTDRGSVAEMIATCCAIALDADKLGELAAALPSRAREVPT